MYVITHYFLKTTEYGNMIEYVFGTYNEHTRVTLRTRVLPLGLTTVNSPRGPFLHLYILNNTTHVSNISKTFIKHFYCVKHEQLELSL